MLRAPWLQSAEATKWGSESSWVLAGLFGVFVHSEILCATNQGYAASLGPSGATLILLTLRWLNA